MHRFGCMYTLINYDEAHTKKSCSCLITTQSGYYKAEQARQNHYFVFMNTEAEIVL